MKITLRSTRSLLPLLSISTAALIACPAPSGSPDPATPPGKNDSPNTAASRPGQAAPSSGAPVVPAPGFVFEEVKVARPDDQPIKAAAPISLTASDGTGLRLLRLEARAVVEEPLAFTQLKLEFENPRDRTIEGRFKITLPVGATISRFAMKIGDRWQEGEVVERQAARRAYEDFLHRRQDPALLEQQGGNEFSARVFPIPARGKKSLIISYSQQLTRSDQDYRLPLRGLPRLDHLDARIMVAKSAAGAAASSLGGSTETREVVVVKK